MYSRFQRLNETRHYPPMSLSMTGDYSEVDLQRRENQRRAERELELQAERDLETRQAKAAARMPVTTALRACAQAERRPQPQHATQTAISLDGSTCAAHDRVRPAAEPAQRHNVGDTTSLTELEQIITAEKKSRTQNSLSPQSDRGDCTRVACRRPGSPSTKTLGKRRADDMSQCDPCDGDRRPAPKKSKTSGRSPRCSAQSVTPTQSRERASSISSVCSLEDSDQPFTRPDSLREARLNSADPSSPKIDSKSPTGKTRPRRAKWSSLNEYLTLLERFERANADHGEVTDNESKPRLSSVHGDRLRRSHEAKYKYHMLWLAPRTIKGCISDLEAAIAGTEGDARSLYDGSTKPLKVVLTWGVLDDAVVYDTKRHVSEAWRIRRWLKGWSERFQYEISETVVEPIWRPEGWEKEGYWQGEVKPRDVSTMATWYREHRRSLPEVPMLGDAPVASQHGMRRMGVLYSPGTDVPITEPQTRRLTPADVQRGEMPEEVWRRLQAQRPKLRLPHRIEQTRELVSPQQLPAIRVFQPRADLNVTLSEPVDLDRVNFGEW
ncbi:hypothetical protein B0A48_01885 [Cryoendolithus antarcticus]|uniref:Uncharacterized protein n=1 Tax=Cryoendolithus antarcticus TaxID=1507870 RepID=A0A1V8TQJ0_9PEZI|nr:hypothetical protein B0A48_01885 [Cryoendolithus antarcticus]